MKDLAEVGHVVGRGLGEDDDIVQVDEGVLPADGGGDNVDCSLEGRWGVFKAEGHTRKKELTVVTCEGSLVAVLRVHHNLPLSLHLGVENGTVTQRVYTRLHAGDGVEVPFGQGVKAAELYEKGKAAVLFWSHDDGRRKVQSSRLDDILVQNGLKVGMFCSPLGWTGSIRRLKDRSGIRLKLNAVRGTLYMTEVAVQLGHEGTEGGEDFVAV